MKKTTAALIAAALCVTLVGCTPEESTPRVYGESEKARANNKCLAYYEDDLGPGGAFDRCWAQLDTDQQGYMDRWFIELEEVPRG